MSAFTLGVIAAAVRRSTGGGGTSSADPFFGNVKLLLHADTGLTDSSPVARTITASNVAVSTAQTKFGAGSAASTGSPPQSSVASSADFATAGNWTLEFFIRCSTFGTQRYFMAAGPTQYFSLSVGGQLTAPGWQSDFAQNLTLNTWHYVKLVHLTDGTCKCYFDGTLISTQTGFTGSTSATALDIFGVPGRSDLTGLGDAWIDEVRFTRAARDTTGVPTAAFPDVGELTFALGSSSVAYSNFNRTAISSVSPNDWVTIPISLPVPISGNWYVEFDATAITDHQMFGVYMSGTPLAGQFLGQSGATFDGVSHGDGARMNGSTFSWVDSTTFSSSGSTSIGISVSQSSGQVRWYRNGTLQASIVSFTPGTPGIYFAIGSYTARGPVTLKLSSAASVPSGFTYIG